ncbi:hypothetical protein ACHAWF_009350 [Thalassiosira exigua]
MVFHYWERGSRFAFNLYRHHNILPVQDKAGRPPIIILSCKGVAQDCIFWMFLYGIGLMPLCEGSRNHVAQSIQTWFSDDLGATGTAEYKFKVMTCAASHSVTNCSTSVMGRMRP